MFGRVQPLTVARVMMVVIGVVIVDRIVMNTNVYHRKSSYIVNVYKVSSQPDTHPKPTNNTPLSIPLFRERKLVIWANDFHIGPIQDLKNLLKPLGVTFIDQSLSGHCRLTKTCAKGLKVVNRANGIKLPRDVIQQFYDAYKNDPMMESVDAFVCYHPSSMCELFMPFNKSILVIASTRYEMGRRPPGRWREWNKNLIKISHDPKNVVAGNNLYDAEYIKYFTGINAKVLESFCGYISESYSPTRPGFLLAPIHKVGFQEPFLNEFSISKKKKRSDVLLEPLRKIYPHYKYSDLTAHQGIVYVPYQVSVMSLFEQYRMNIPLFFPSRDLLANWQLKHHVMKERTWAMVHHRIPSKSAIDGVANGMPDPNNEKDLDAIKYWISFSDFYQWPHVTYYNSTDDLVTQLETANLKQISAKMKEFNSNLKVNLLNTWTDILLNIAKNSKNKPI